MAKQPPSNPLIQRPDIGLRESAIAALVAYSFFERITPELIHWYVDECDIVGEYRLVAPITTMIDLFSDFETCRQRRFVSYGGASPSSLPVNYDSGDAFMAITKVADTIQSYLQFRAGCSPAFRRDLAALNNHKRSITETFTMLSSLWLCSHENVVTVVDDEIGLWHTVNSLGVDPAHKIQGWRFATLSADTIKSCLRNHPTLKEHADDYIEEAEHQEGVEYWATFKTIEDAVSDLSNYVVLGIRHATSGDGFITGEFFSSQGSIVPGWLGAAGRITEPCEENEGDDE